MGAEQPAHEPRVISLPIIVNHGSCVHKSRHPTLGHCTDLQIDRRNRAASRCDSRRAAQCTAPTFAVASAYSTSAAGVATLELGLTQVELLGRALGSDRLEGRGGGGSIRTTGGLPISCATRGVA